MYTINYLLANGDKLDNGCTLRQYYNETEAFGSLTHKLKCDNGQLKRQIELKDQKLESKNQEIEQLRKKIALENSLEFSFPENVTSRN